MSVCYSVDINWRLVELQHWLRVNYCQVLADFTWTRYFTYRQVEYVVNILSISHYACNFFLFIPTARHFRQALIGLLVCRCDEQSTTTSTTPNLTATWLRTPTPSPALVVRRAN